MSEWICFPDDFEIMLYNRENDKRYERDVRVFSMYRRAGLTPAVLFQKKFTLTRTDTVKILYDGNICVRLDDGQYIYGFDGTLNIPAGEHSLYIALLCDDGRLPCIYVEGEELHSDGSWTCTDGVNIQSPVGTTGLTDPAVSPNAYALPVRPHGCTARDAGGQTLYDCGEELVAYLRFTGVKGKGKLSVYYGESEEEALDPEECETLDVLSAAGESELVTPIAKGFRYFTVGAEGVSFEGPEVLEEYVPHAQRTRFHSEDALLNRIWDISMHTMDLTTRLFFLDGVKRDRWVWGGDAYQSILMNRFGFFDTETAKRTLVGLLGVGKYGFRQHINNINSYSLLVLIAVEEFYDQTGDEAFLRRIWPRAGALAQFCISRLDKDGFMVGYPEDWVFVDWSDTNPSAGALSYNQMLLCAALRSMGRLAGVLGEREEAKKYEALSARLYENIQKKLWSEEAGCYIYSLVGGKPNRTVMRQPNLMAVLFGIATPHQQRLILQNVLLNDAIPDTKTPYMMFFELAALAGAGEKALVYERMTEYWGGMAKEGVSTFWELYDPAERGAEKYAMYGRKYGKSLCHAWGATPLYIIGGYLAGLGVRQGKVIVRPEQIACMPDFELEAPVVRGSVRVCKRGGEYTVEAIGEGVTVEIPAAVAVNGAPCCAGQRVEVAPGNSLRIALEDRREYEREDLHRVLRQQQV